MCLSFSFSFRAGVYSAVRRAERCFVRAPGILPCRARGEQRPHPTASPARMACDAVLLCSSPIGVLIGWRTVLSAGHCLEGVSTNIATPVFQVKDFIKRGYVRVGGVKANKGKKYKVSRDSLTCHESRGKGCGMLSMSLFSVNQGVFVVSFSQSLTSASFACFSLLVHCARAHVSTRTAHRSPASSGTPE